MPNPYDRYGQAPSTEDLFPSESRPRRERYVPKVRKRQPEVQEPEVPETEEELGWFQKYGPHVARGIGGLFGVTPVTGAIGGAAGELAAQAIEQGDLTPDIDPRRLAAETAIGAAGGGFAKLLGAGVTSVGRALGAGAALGGAAPVIRHGFEEGEWDPREYAGEVGTGAALGGAVGGGLAKLFKTVSKPAGPASRYEIETTSVPGGQTLGAGGKQKTQFVNPVRPIHGTGDVPTAAAPAPTTRVPYDADDIPQPLDTSQSGVPYLGGDVALLPSQSRLIDQEARAAERAAKEADRLRIAADKQRLEEEKLGELKKLFEGRGDVETRLSESVSAVDPATGHRLGATFREVAEEGADGGGRLTRQQQLAGLSADDVGDLSSEIERVRAELAQARAAEVPQAPEPVMAAPEAPIPPQTNVPAPSPLAEVLSPPQAGKTRPKRAGKGKTERFNERAAAIAAQAEAPRAPEAAQPQSLAELLGQVSPEHPPVRVIAPGEGMVSAPIGSDPAEALAALRSAGPEAPALPEAPQDLLQILRTRVGATGKNYRLAKEAAKSGEIPTADYARQAHLTEQAALRAPKAAPEAPVPSPASWVDDEMAVVERLSQLPKEQRMAAFLGEEVPAPVVSAPEAPLATPDAEPAWVAEQMAEVGRMTPTPPTAAQVSELEKLLMASGAIKDPSEMPKWVTSQIQQAPEAPKPPTATPGDTAPLAPQDPRVSLRPRLVKKPGERGAYPAALAARLGLGVAGAAIGGATDPFEDPVLSALAGGAVGLSIPTMAEGLMKLGAAPDAVQSAMQDLNLPDGIKRAAAKVGRVLPQMQRANYLADAVGLPANAWFGPYGSGVFGALERGLAGDPRGWAVLSELANPWNFFKEYPSAFQEARDLVGRAEGFSEAEAIGEFEKRLTWPGTALTAGDVAIRRILVRHGFSDDEARIITMTGEPFTKSGESLAHMRGLVPDITFPFKRTPINIVEQGLLRTPGVGFLQQGVGAARGTRPADALGVQLAQQGMGAGVALGSEQLAENLDPEQARILRRFATNFAGPYSLLAGAGFAAGQAARRGQPIAGTTLRTTAQQLPLPSIEPISDALSFGGKLLDQGPDAIQPQDIPRGAYPTALTPSNLQRQYDALASFFTEPALPPRRRRRAP